MYWEFNFYLLLKAGSGNLMLPGHTLGSWLNDSLKAPQVPRPNSYAGMLASWSLSFPFDPTPLQVTISCHLILLVKLKTPAVERKHARHGCLWRYRNIFCLKDTIPLYFSDKMLECCIHMNSALFFRPNKTKTQIFFFNFTLFKYFCIFVNKTKGVQNIKVYKIIQNIFVYTFFSQASRNNN